MIITTHYIEEARQAHVVGLMRHGRLLAEDAPDALLTKHNMETLEEVFLKLCMSDSSERAAAMTGNTSLTSVAVPAISASGTPIMKRKEDGDSKEIIDNNNESKNGLKVSILYDLIVLPISFAYSP